MYFVKINCNEIWPSSPSCFVTGPQHSKQMTRVVHTSFWYIRICLKVIHKNQRSRRCIHRWRFCTTWTRTRDHPVISICKIDHISVLMNSRFELIQKLPKGQNTSTHIDFPQRISIQMRSFQRPPLMILRWRLPTVDSFWPYHPPLANLRHLGASEIVGISIGWVQMHWTLLSILDQMTRNPQRRWWQSLMDSPWEKLRFLSVH